MEHKRFEDKVAIVTGGASGIGYAIAERLLAEGARVVIADGNERKLKELEDSHGDKLLGVQANVMVESDIENLVKKTIETFGRLDFGFNVAGVSKSSQIMELPEGEFNLDLCLMDVFLCVKHQAKYMKDHGGGAIVNIAPLHAHVPLFAGGVYDASAKAGVEMLTKNTAFELAKYNIRVNAVLPGLVSTTPLTSQLTTIGAIHEAYIEHIPMKRAADPTEIAGPALFLVSEDAAYVNGTSLIVDGAWAKSGYADLSNLF